ncbi:MAG: hypothetical protein CMJ78_18605 [Planctomycetaceae bacterium]|nr:hypothetical protein [Planctomycetaceae bacterium]
MWQLPFDNGVTSVGIVLDADKYPLESNRRAEDEWAEQLERYPSIARQLMTAKLVAPERVVRTSRMQRFEETIADDDWALLPNTAGFIDPLHSTGIAHSLCGIELLADCLTQFEGPERTDQLALYSKRVRQALTHIDELMRACYLSLSSFRAFAASTMMYFAAATTFERRRLEANDIRSGAFLCADEEWEIPFGWLASHQTDMEERAEEYEQLVMQCIDRYNHVGLMNPSLNNMYSATALPE